MGFSAHYRIYSSQYSDLKGWNKEIKKQMQEGNLKLAFSAFVRMQESGFCPDNFTLPVLLEAAGRHSLVHLGHALHGQTVKSGYCDHLFVQTSLMNMYSRFNDIKHAHKVFDDMLVKDVIAWNSILDAYASHGKMEEATKLFDSMPKKDLTSFNIMISGYAKAGELESARILFNEAPEIDVASYNSMILACKLAGDMEEARRLFEEAPSLNIITWNTMMSGYIHNELYNDAIGLYDRMMAQNVEPDHLTLAGVLAACAHLSSLEAGTIIHIYALQNHLMCQEVTTSLIDMYAKCGTIAHALEVFYKSPVKDIFCWNSVLSGLALNGHGIEALKLFNAMKSYKSLRPDDITFIAVLGACSHAGLVKEGCSIFASMEKDFGVFPKIEHYGCMVDLLGRANLLSQALQLVESMPFKPGERVLGALLSASVIHQNIDVGEKAVRLVMENGIGLSDGEFMMMSNLYASFSEWEKSTRWRENMTEKGIVKTTGCSVIVLNGKCHKFLAGNSSVDWSDSL